MMASSQKRQKTALAHPNIAELDGYIVLSPANRQYYTGFSGSSGVVVVTRQGAWLITDFRYVEQARHEAVGVHVVQGHGDLWQSVREILDGLSVRRMGFESRFMTVDQWAALTLAIPDVQWRAVDNGLDAVRMIKDVKEVQTLRRAVSVAERGLRDVRRFINVGTQEMTLARELDVAMRRAGAQGSAFPTIVASGPRGALPHAHPTGKELASGECVTIDFGATVDGYHSDQTVTMVVGGENPKQARLRAIYDIVLEAQERGIAAVGPGVAAHVIDDVCRAYIAGAGFGEYFGHATGHGIGLAVHEAPILRGKNETILRPGMVVTVEPGIYVPGLGGVRLEDMVLVTEDGVTKLTSWPKTWTVV